MDLRLNLEIDSISVALRTRPSSDAYIMDISMYKSLYYLPTPVFLNPKIPKDRRLYTEVELNQTPGVDAFMKSIILFVR